LVFEVLEKESSTNTAFLASNTTTGNQEKENVFSPLLVLTQINNKAQNHKTIKKRIGAISFCNTVARKEIFGIFSTSHTKKP
jgi:hypothetical protein